MLGCDKIRISMLFIYQLKTSDDVQTEQAPIDDKKEEETWPAFRQLLKRRRSFCDIEKWVLCTKMRTTVIIVRIAGQVVDLNALSTMAMVPLSTFVHLLKDKLNLENWNVWIDHPIVTMFFFVLLLKLIGIVKFHRSIEKMIIIFFQYIVLKSESILNKCYVEFCIVLSFFLFLCCVRKVMNPLTLNKGKHHVFLFVLEIDVVSFLYLDTVTEY